MIPVAAAVAGTLAGQVVGSRLAKETPQVTQTPQSVTKVDTQNSPQTMFSGPVNKDMPNRNNNPGSIEYNATTKKWLDQFGATQDPTNPRWAKFPDVESGVDAIKYALTQNYSPETTVKKALFTWTGSGLEGLGYGPKEVQMQGNKKIKNLTEQELGKLIYGIAKFEGFKQLDKLKMYLNIK